MHRASTLAAACITAWALVACGGGGGNGNGNAVGASDMNAVPSTGTTSQGQDVAAPKLTNNTAVDGRVWLNYRRTQLGLPELTENGMIDQAAQRHSDYQVVNGITHTEDPAKQGFTGVTLDKRMNAAGYTFRGSNAIGEVIAASTSTSGFYNAEQLITAIYHRFVIFEPVFKEIGSGAATASGANGYTYFTADMAANNGLGQGLVRGTVVTWPFSGQTQVTPNFFSNQEEPDPVPDRDEVGYPISVHANMSSTLTVKSFTVRPHGGSDLPVKQIGNQTTNAQGQAVAPTAVAIIPLSPLAGKTTYDVSFNGTVDGTPVSKSWSFTTK
ncbi:CAP domain-containing protein [Massilia sp. 9096]|uniref:CAP domain-containing protein n=1 Tax=Massilia sp. 9096 TaxID=1500894 RepID=UPI0009DFCA8E|nr:CAP domain-containing protein [Massilia sp. 9096]